MPNLTLIDFFDKGFEVSPDRDFLVDHNGARTYRTVKATTHRLANAMAAAGIAPGTHVGVFSPNSAEAFEGVLGTLRAGCVWISLNLRNSIGDNIHVLNNNAVEVLFYAPELHDSILEIRAHCPGIKHFVSLGAATALSPSYQDFLADQPEMSPEIARAPEDPVVLLSSGGTTGAPKGVRLSQRAWQTMILGLSDIYRCEHPVMLMVAPITHASGTLALGVMHMGTTNVILPGFDALAVMKAIAEHRVTHLFLPPTAIYVMLAHPDVRSFDYSSLTHIICASAPMSIDKMKEAISVFGPVMCQMYGQTETLTTVTYHSPADLARAFSDPALEHRLASVGKPCLVARVEIMDDEGRLLPRGEIGEIVVRGDMLCDDYYGNPTESAALRLFDWHHTSDVGHIDEEGYLYIVDRKRDMIISGGFNIFPSEIEQVIWSHPGVRDCAVIGIPDDKWGEAVTAMVELKDGVVLDAAELQAYCRARLAAMKVPKMVRFVDELPRSAVGKVLKKALREPFWQGRPPGAVR